MYLAPGWWVNISPSRSIPATDAKGPFDTFCDLRRWLRENGIAYVAGRGERVSVPYHVEMVDTCPDDWSPWATGIRRVG